MKLDRRHLVGSLVILAASIVYNIWSATQPAGTGATAVRPMDGPLAGAPVNPEGNPAAGGVDPMQVPAPPDVALDRLPEWPRDPFADLAVRAPETVDAGATQELEPAPDPDPVIASILYSETRRLAMMNGRIVRVGDQVGSDRIIDILPNAVIVESPTRGRRTLPLRVPSTPVARQ